MTELTPVTSVASTGPLGRDFGLFWTAQATASVGAQISELALPLLAVTTLGASAGELGALGVARWVPFLILALPLGVVVDRRRRRPLLVAADVMRALVVVAVVLLAVAGHLDMTVLVVLMLLIGAFTVLFEVSYQSYLPTIVAGPGLERANGRLQATEAAAEVGGPGLGGLLVQAFSAPLALLVHAVTYLVSALAMSRIRAEETPPNTPRRGFGGDLLEGLRHVRRDSVLVSLAGFAGLYNFFAQWIMVLFTLHAVRVWGLDAGQIGVVFSLGALGAFAGAALSGRAVRRWGAGVSLVTCAIVECGALAVIPLVDDGWSSSATIGALAGAFALNGAGTALSSVVAVTIRQLRTPGRVLGRVNATMRWLSYGTIAGGAAVGGLVGQVAGTGAGIAYGCAGTVTVVVWVVCSPLRRVRDPLALAVPAEAGP